MLSTFLSPILATHPTNHHILPLNTSSTSFLLGSHFSQTFIFFLFFYQIKRPYLATMKTGGKIILRMLIFCVLGIRWGGVRCWTSCQVFLHLPHHRHYLSLAEFVFTGDQTRQPTQPKCNAHSRL